MYVYMSRCSMSCALTRLLKDACGGNSRSTILLAVTPALRDRTATYSAFQFAKTAQVILNKPRFNRLDSKAAAAAKVVKSRGDGSDFELSSDCDAEGSVAAAVGGGECGAQNQPAVVVM